MLKKIALFLVVLALCLAALEVYVNSTSSSRWQRVYNYEMVGDTPVWRSSNKDAEAVANLDCAQGGRADVAILGDSILYGIRIPVEDALAPRMSQRLVSADKSNACVVNLAVPGFTLEQELAVIKRDWNTLQPRIVVLEVWANSPHRVQVVGGMLFNFGYLAVDEEGLPNPFDVSSSLNRTLFGTSALWRRAVQGAAKRNADTSILWSSTNADVIAFNEWLMERNSRLVLASAVNLGSPWSAGREEDRGHYAQLGAWASSNDIPAIWFDEVLASQPVESVRLDTCCHLNALGLHMVGDSLEKVIQPLLID